MEILVWNAAGGKVIITPARCFIKLDYPKATHTLAHTHTHTRPYVFDHRTTANGRAPGERSASVAGK